ncbi:MAG: hypothetical protein M3547_14585, partial [Acidobacteriota bacterium]|nr:hypothetical protein [Acidobacteriota bacterium]
MSKRTIGAVVLAGIVASASFAAQSAAKGKTVGTAKGATASRAAIPSRPEKLSFPPLTYEPPSPADYRVKLASGPVAYVVPDKELPLVNLVVYVRAGQYLVPAGKEGLAD